MTDERKEGQRIGRYDNPDWLCIHRVVNHQCKQCFPAQPQPRGSEALAKELAQKYLMRRDNRFHHESYMPECRTELVELLLQFASAPGAITGQMVIKFDSRTGSTHMTDREQWGDLMAEQIDTALAAATAERTQQQIVDEMTAIVVEHLNKLPETERECRIVAFEKAVNHANQPPAERTPPPPSDFEYRLYGLDVDNIIPPRQPAPPQPVMDTARHFEAGFQKGMKRGWESAIEAAAQHVPLIMGNEGVGCVCGWRVNSSDTWVGHIRSLRPSPAPRCQERNPEVGQCELREGHDGKHLGGYLMWKGPSPAPQEPK